MAIEGIESAPRSQITVAGVLLEVVAPFTEGHVLRANEAAVLNQTYGENIRNNTTALVKKAIEDAGGLENIDATALQAKVNSYINTYDFGVRRGGGLGRVSLDPVTKEAIRIASDKVKEALRKQGNNLKDIGAKKIRELAEQALEKYPQIREAAEQAVALKSEIGIGELELGGEDAEAA